MVTRPVARRPGPSRRWAGRVGAGRPDGQHPDPDVPQRAVAPVVDLDVHPGQPVGHDPPAELGQPGRSRPAVVLELHRGHRLVTWPRGHLQLDVRALPPRPSGAGPGGGGAAGAQRRGGRRTGGAGVQGELPDAPAQQADPEQPLGPAQGEGQRRGVRQPGAERSPAGPVVLRPPHPGVGGHDHRPRPLGSATTAPTGTSGSPPPRSSQVAPPSPDRHTRPSPWSASVASSASGGRPRPGWWSDQAAQATSGRDGSTATPATRPGRGRAVPVTVQVSPVRSRRSSSPSLVPASRWAGPDRARAVTAPSTPGRGVAVQVEPSAETARPPGPGVTSSSPASTAGSPVPTGHQTSPPS